MRWKMVLSAFALFAMCAICAAPSYSQPYSVPPVSDACCVGCGANLSKGERCTCNEEPSSPDDDDNTPVTNSPSTHEQPPVDNAPVDQGNPGTGTQDDNTNNGTLDLKTGTTLPIKGATNTQPQNSPYNSLPIKGSNPTQAPNGSTTTLPIKGSSTTQPLPIKPSSNVPTLKEKTIKALKELNCSAHWGIQAARVSLGGYSSMTDLEDDLDMAKKYLQYSADAAGGKSISGCSPVIVNVPENPPALEANPQIRLYNFVIQEINVIVPKVIEAKEKIKQTEIKKNELEIKKDSNRKEIEKVVSKLMVTQDQTERDPMIKKIDESNAEYDDLMKQILEQKKIAEGLNAEVEVMRETFNDLESSVNTVESEPDKAAELLQNLQNQ